MENLWKKEEINATTLYIDLCKSINPEYFEAVIHQVHELTSKYKEISSKSNVKSLTYMQKANHFYQESDFECAMHKYTEALCYAESGTATVSMAFANRAQCFFRMKNYHQALIDCDLALSVGCTNEELLSMLRKLQGDCQKFNASGECKQLGNERQHRLDFEEHTKFPCLANALTIKHSAVFGHHIVAKHDIDVGKVVLMEESFASVAKSNERVCYTCLAESQNFIACPNCVDAIFCDENCLNANMVHRLECQTLYHGLPHKIQFIIRTILVAITAFPSIDSLMAFVEEHIGYENLPESINDLQSKYSLYLHLEKFPMNDTAANDVFCVFKLIMAIPSIRMLFDLDRKKRFLMHLIFHHLAVNVNNGYENETTTSIGLLLCLFNHSCAPNLFNYAVDNDKFCVTIRPVKKDDQVKTSVFFLSFSFVFADVWLQFSYFNFGSSL